MQNPPKGYWNIHQAVRWAEVTREDHRATVAGKMAEPLLAVIAREAEAVQRALSGG